MTAPASIRQADAERIFQAARKAGALRASVDIRRGMVDVVFADLPTASEPLPVDDGEWSDDDV